MKSFLTVLFVLIGIVFMINFPITVIGMAIAIWGLYALQKNKKLNVKSKMAPVLLLLAVSISLVGCAPTPEDDEVEKAVTTEEVKDKTSEQTVADEKAEEVVTIEEEEVKEEIVVAKKPVDAAIPQEKAPVKKATQTAGTTDQIPVTLVRTIDGDTIKILYEGKEVNVRYLLIDTPETSHPKLGKQPFGEAAKERNRQLVNSGELTIEFDIGERTDKYGRLLAYVYVDGKSVQKSLLAEGLARVAYVYPPNTRHLTPFEEVQAIAKEKGLGIWSIENYATESGFKSKPAASVSSGSTPTPSKSSTGSTSTSPTTSAVKTGGQEWFQNCTELRKKYPSGVPAGHAAYQPKMDRDKDNFACER